MIYVDAPKTRALLKFNELIDALRRMFVTGCHVPRRHVHEISLHENAVGTVLLMPAWSDSGYLGVKTVCIYPCNGNRNLPGLHSSYVLYDASTGEPLAHLDGNEITSRRTAAASALAASYLAAEDARTLTIVGAGRVGSLLAEAYCAVRPIEQVFVWDIHLGKAEVLAEALRASRIEAAATDDLEYAVRASRIVSCATLSTKPLVCGRWLRPGTHLDLIGGFTANMRESDDECFRVGSVFIDTQEALEKAGDLLYPIQSAAFDPSNVVATLGDLCQGRHKGRRTGSEITVFKAVGTALEDLAAAALVYSQIQGVRS